MCGICGIVNLNHQPVKEADLKSMMLKIKHRGPNDEGVFQHENMGFGFVRLSIIDLSSAGHQPMQDESGRYTIVFNGEIFNYIELREELVKQGQKFHSQTDTEVLLNMYINYGAACLNKLNGMFAFAIHDKETNRIFAARDRFGVKPFYYAMTETGFVFASEIPAILEVYGKENKANHSVIFDYLAFNRTDHTENTFFEGIKKLQHGHCVEIQDGKVNIQKWYDLKSKISNQKGDIAYYKSLLTDAVRIRLRSDVPVGVCLSGGLDSSAITSIIASELNNPAVNTFSAVYTPDKQADESKFINLYKPLLTNMHAVVPDADKLLEQLDYFIRIHAEPIPSTSPFAQYCVMELAQKHVTVTLDGQGADEQLGGYHYFFGFYFKDLLTGFKWKTLFREIKDYLKIHKSLYGIKTMFYFLLPNALKTKAGVDNRGFLDKRFVKKVLETNRSVIVHDLYASENLKSALLNHFEFKLEHLLKWNDRNSMAFSVESRTPFLDYRLVEYTLSIEPEFIIKNGVTKSILRESLKGVLPEEIRNRQDKVGFATPQDEWFREPAFRSFIGNIIKSESFRDRQIMDADKARLLYEKHLKGEINIAKDIWKWIHLELWFRTFIDKK